MFFGIHNKYSFNSFIIFRCKIKFNIRIILCCITMNKFFICEAKWHELVEIHRLKIDDETLLYSKRYSYCHLTISDHGGAEIFVKLIFCLQLQNVISYKLMLWCKYSILNHKSFIIRMIPAGHSHYFIRNNNSILLSRMQFYPSIQFTIVSFEYFVYNDIHSRSNDMVRIRPFAVTLRRINGPYTAVILGTEIRPYHNEITASYTVSYYCAQYYG